MSMNKRQTFAYILSLSLEKKAWLVLFTIGSIVARVTINFFPIRVLLNRSGEHLENHTLTILATTEQTRKAVQMGQLMSMVGNNTPWGCKCLCEALIVNFLLKLYKIPSVVYFGALIDSQQKSSMKAHAWVDVGKRTVIGAPQHRRYRVTATFTNPKLS